MELRPHDLVRLRSPDALAAGGAPAWVARSLSVAPWVVVRRAASDAGRIAVGVRGQSRSERFAAFLEPDGVAKRFAPEELSRRAQPRDHPVLDALSTLRPALDATGLAWGPAGGAGFELATGRPVLTPTSDLDLIVRLDPADPLRGPGEGPSRLKKFAALRRIQELAARSGVPVDVMVETPMGGFALGEFLRADEEVMLRTNYGPRLIRKASLLVGLVT